jgi:hypothetical protein
LMNLDLESRSVIVNQDGIDDVLLSLTI